MRSALLPFLVGCAPGAPTAMTDSFWLSPGEGGQIDVLATWSYYDAQPATRPNYVCAQIGALTLEPDDPCAACSYTWRILTFEVLDGDCPSEVDLDPTLVPTGLGAGDLPTDLSGADPWPAVTAGGHVRYPNGDWQAHGWVVPEGVGAEMPVEAPGWTGEAPATWWPAWALTLP